MCLLRSTVQTTAQTAPLFYRSSMHWIYNVCLCSRHYSKQDKAEHIAINPWSAKPDMCRFRGVAAYTASLGHQKTILTPPRRLKCPGGTLLSSRICHSPGICTYKVPPPENRTRNDQDSTASFSRLSLHNFVRILGRPSKTRAVA